MPEYRAKPAGGNHLDNFQCPFSSELYPCGSIICVRFNGYNLSRFVSTP